MTASLTWVDAFTDRVFSGNPAGVCLPSEPMSAEYMQALAKELGIGAWSPHQLSPRGAVLHVRPEGARVHIGGNAVTVFTGYV